MQGPPGAPGRGPLPGPMSAGPQVPSSGPSPHPSSGPMTPSQGPSMPPSNLSQSSFSANAMSPGFPRVEQRPGMAEDRLIIGNRVTVSNMEAARMEAANHAAVLSNQMAAGYGAQTAGMTAAATAAAMAARQQQYAAAYGQQYPGYDYAALYGADWMQRDPAAAAAAFAGFNFDRSERSRSVSRLLKRTDIIKQL